MSAIKAILLDTNLIMDIATKLMITNLTIGMSLYYYVGMIYFVRSDGLSKIKKFVVKK